MKTIIRVIDLETGFDPVDGKNGIVEYGHCDLVTTSFDMFGAPFDWDLNHEGDYGFSSLVNPGAPITAETSAIHNLIDEDVRRAPTWDEVSHRVSLVGTEETIAAYAAHNIECERTLIGPDITGDKPWICTYKVAMHLWPHFTRHTNGAIRYALNPEGLDRSLASPTHRAFPDAYVTAFTLREALNLGHSIETLVSWTNAPALLPRCKIGKDYNNNGKGTPWTEVTTSMLEWILARDFDEDTMYTVKFHLEQREIDQRLDAEKRDLERQMQVNGLSTEAAPAQNSTLNLDL